MVQYIENYQFPWEACAMYSQLQKCVPHFWLEIVWLQLPVTGSCYIVLHQIKEHFSTCCFLTVRELIQFNQLLGFLLYKLNRLISFNCGTLSLVFNTFSGSLLNPLQIFNMLLKMHVTEVIMVWSIILVSTTYGGTTYAYFLLLFTPPIVLPKTQLLAPLFLL